MDRFDRSAGDGTPDPQETDPSEPHAFLAADTFVPLGPFSGRGAAIRGLMTPAAIVDSRADHCALCGRSRQDPFHGLADA